MENQQAGDVYRSHDGGNNWEALPGVHGKSVRAMAIAPYDSKVLVIGALDGVFRTKDGGNNWEPYFSGETGGRTEEHRVARA